MGEILHEQDQEIAAIATISAALARITDDEARGRVIAYVLSRYMPTAVSTQVTVGRTPQIIPGLAAATPSPSIGGSHGTNEIAGIARLTEAGDLHLTIRDLKARSGLDAAVRLAHVAIYAQRQLTGQPLSSAKSLTPILKSWRVYDGNTRTRLAKDKGILRVDDELSLDAHATRDAERFIQEILDPDVEGKWKPK